MDSLLSPCTQMLWSLAIFPPKSVRDDSLPCNMSVIASRYRFGVPMSNQLPFSSYPYTGLPVLMRYGMKSYPKSRRWFFCMSCFMPFSLKIWRISGVTRYNPVFARFEGASSFVGFSMNLFIRMFLSMSAMP